MAELRKDIPVTYEFEDYIPPEEDGAIFGPQDDSRMVMAERSSGEPFNPPDSWYTAEPDVAYTLGVEDKEKREAFLKSMPDPNLGRPRVSTGRLAVKKNLSRRTMSDEAGTSSGAGTNNDYARGAQPHIYQLKQSRKRKARKSQRMGSEKTKRQKKRAGLQQTKHGIAKECSPKKNA